MDYEEDDRLNDETFGVNASSVGKDFDFTRSSAVQNGHPQQQRVLTVEELERQFSQQHLLPASLETQSSLPTTYRVIPQKLSVAELESQMLAAQQFPMSAPQGTDAANISGTAAATAITAPHIIENVIPQEHMEVLIKLQQEESEFEQRKAKFDGLMTQSEKDFIAKIQLSQLAGDPMYREDFYYKTWLAKKEEKYGGIAFPGAASDASKNVQSSEKDEISKEDRFQKLLSEVKVRPKATQVDIAGALGVVAVNSLRNPKQLIQLKFKEPAANADALKGGQAGNGQKKSSQSYQKILSTIETIFLDLIAIDQMYSRWQSESKSITQSDPEVVKEKHSQWNQEYTAVVKEIWQKLISFEAKTTKDEVLLKTMPAESGMASVLSYGKGRKMIARVLKCLPADLSLLLLKSVFLSSGKVVIKSVDPAQIIAELDDYANNAVFPFVNLISNVPIQYVNSCLEDAIQRPDFGAITKSKPGLLFVTLFISRAALIKQKNPASVDTDPAYQSWAQQVFPALFKVHEGHFNELFPPSHIMPSIMSSATGQLAKAVEVDQQYVWQFFAAMAHCCTLDQQRVLVTELRDKIIETVFRQGEDGKRKVNIFLNALGLDASQLTG